MEQMVYIYGQSNLHAVLLRDAAVGPKPGKEPVFQVNDGFSHFFITGKGVIIIDRDFQIFFLR